MCMGKLLGNTAMPVYIKLLSAAILAITYLAVLVYAGIFAAAHNWTLDNLPPLVSNFLVAGLVMALSNLGIHTGASVTESGNQMSQGPATPAPTPAQPATPPSGV